MQLNRRTFLMGSGAAAYAATKKTVTPPNIVLVIADDLAAWMVGCYGNKEIRTPNIDMLARTGLRFVNSFTSTPICSPSRATLFTGRVPRQHGIYDFLDANPIENPPQGQAAPPASFASEVMLSDILSAQGYNCGYSGKWHMGNDEQPKHGYQYTYTMLGGSSPYQNPRMSLNGEVRQEQGYMADLITQHACAFLDQQSASKPFFLTVSHFNPHTPYEGHPQKYYDMYANNKFESFGWEPAAPNALREKNMLSDIVGNIRKCAAATTALDDQIPVLVKKLQDRGVRDNTLIVFTGDNGYLLGRHGLWSKGEASNPYNMYEEVVGVPMIWSWPGKVPAEAYAPEMISFYDFVPSICEVTGASVPARNLTGRSYAKIAMRQRLPKKEPWNNLVFGQMRNTEMARDKRYKVVLRDEGKGPGELYDIATDPREKVNQYDNPQFSTVRQRLTRDVADWRARTSK